MIDPLRAFRLVQLNVVACNGSLCYRAELGLAREVTPGLGPSRSGSA